MPGTKPKPAPKRAPALPEWINQTPEEDSATEETYLSETKNGDTMYAYRLGMWEQWAQGEAAQCIETTRAEYILLKKYLAKLRWIGAEVAHA